MTPVKMITMILHFTICTTSTHGTYLNTDIYWESSSSTYEEKIINDTHDNAVNGGS